VKVSAQIVVNGSPINVKSLEVSLTKTKKSETFSASVAMYDPAAQGLDSADGAQASCLINGAQIGGSFQLEHVDYSFDGTEVTLSGRDNSADMIDTPNTKTFTNQTPKQVIQALAQGVGTNIDDMGANAGKIYQLDWNAITHRASAWEAIQHLADLYGKAAYVTGGTLYVKDMDESLPVYSLQWSRPSASGAATSNILTLKASRNFQMSKKINVTAHGHNYKQQQTLTATASAGGSGSGALNYNYVIPSATQDQLQNVATKKSKEHSRHALDIAVEIPGDTGVVIRMQLRLSGTGTVFDTLFDMTDVSHKVDFDGGYTTTIKGNAAGA